MANNAKVSFSSGFTHSKGAGGKVMLLTADRVVYLGLIGKPQTREFGSLTVYVSLGVPFQIQVGKREWENAEIYVVAPDTPHCIMTSDHLIGVVMIEAETVDLARLPEWLQPTRSTDQYLQAFATIRRFFSALSNGGVERALLMENVDEFVFGQSLERRLLDPRIAAVVAKINNEPCGLFGAEECATYINLSCSRFLHLFKEEVGTTFRGFRAWKRARSFLNYVNTEVSLTDIALDIGYPDSSHFSHTVRRYWGLTPRDIVAGSRKLAVINRNTLASAAC